MRCIHTLHAPMVVLVTILTLHPPALSADTPPLVATTPDDVVHGQTMPARLSAEDRVAGFFDLWYETKYNFAFFDRVPDVNWDAVRREFLPLVIRDQSDDDYYRLLQRCMALLRDGHTEVILERPRGSLPLRVRMLEGRAIVTEVFQSPQTVQAAVKPGMELTHLGGAPVPDLLARDIYPYISASTPQGRDRSAAETLVRGQPNATATLTIQDVDGRPRTVMLTLGDVSRLPWFARRPPLEYRPLSEGIAVVAIHSFGSDRVVREFDNVFDNIRRSRGLVIDIRDNGGGDSGNADAIVARLIDRPVQGHRWRTRQYLPAFRAWGMKESWYQGKPVEIRPRGQTWDGPLVILIGPDTASAAEDFLIPLVTRKRATLVGEATAGTTGQPLFIQLPGGRRARICTKRDTWPDGTEFVGVGVLPDAQVRPTRDDIAAGRDVVLEHALEFLKARASSQPADGATATHPAS